MSFPMISEEKKYRRWRKNPCERMAEQRMVLQVPWTRNKKGSERKGV